MAQEIKKSQPQTVAPRYADPFGDLRADWDRLFENFIGRGFGRMPALFGKTSEIVMPNMDIKESANELLVEAELPGLEEKDVNVVLANGMLTIKGEKKSEREEKKQDYHLTERSYGKFERSFQLPDTIDEGRISAAFDKGVLKVVMPKRPDAAKAEKTIPIGKAR